MAETEDIMSDEERNGRQMFTGMDEVRRVWRRQRLKSMGIFSLFMVGGVVGLVVLSYVNFDSSPRRTFASGDELFLYRLISAPTSLMDLLSQCVVVLCFCIGFFKFFVHFGKLISGPPKASRNPEKSIRQFFNAALVAAGTIDRSSVAVEALCYLTPEAAAAAGGWDGFRKYWTDKNKEIVEALLKKQGFEQSNSTVASVRKLGSAIDSNRYSVTIHFAGKSGDGTMGRPVRTYGPWPYLVECSVTERDGRYYMASSEWNGRPEASVEVKPANG